MPKIYSVDFKSSVLNFYFSDLFTIDNTIYIFGISKSTLYNWVESFKKHSGPTKVGPDLIWKRLQSQFHHQNLLKIKNTFFILGIYLM